MFNERSMSILNLMKISVLQCPKGSWRWVHGQQIETCRVKIKTVVSQVKLDPPQQILSVFHHARAAAGHETPAESRIFVVPCGVYSYCWRKLLTWWGELFPPEPFRRYRVVGAVSSSAVFPFGCPSLSPKEPLSLLSQITMECVSLELKISMI